MTQRIALVVAIAMGCGQPTGGPASPQSPEPTDEAVASNDAGVAATDAGGAALAQASPAPPPRTRVPDSGCLDPQSPRIEALRKQAEVWAQQSFEAELARRGLTTVKLGARSLHLHRGIGGFGQHNQGHPDGTVVEATVENVSGKFVAGYTHWSGQATWPQPWQFVRDRDGIYFRLIRSGQLSARSMDIFVCACRQQRCGPYGSGCPACGSTSQLMYGPLPAGARYGGEITVTYDHPDVSLHFAKSDCPAPQRCPDPPP